MADGDLVVDNNDAMKKLTALLQVHLKKAAELLIKAGDLHDQGVELVCNEYPQELRDKNGEDIGRSMSLAQDEIDEYFRLIAGVVLVHEAQKLKNSGGACNAQTVAPDNSGSVCGSEGTVYLHSRCHPTTPTWVAVTGNVLTAECSECEQVVARFDVVEHKVGT